MDTLRVLDTAVGMKLGDHVSWAYDDPADLVSAATDYLAEGAARRERLVYIGSKSELELVDDLALLPERDRMLETGQLAARPLASLFDSRPGAHPHVDEASLRGELDRALADGCPGMRVAADLTELAEVPARMNLLVEYEIAMDAMTAEATMTALCGFDRRRTGARWTQVSALHGVRHGGGTDLQLAVSPGHGAVSLSGEIDVANVDDLRTLLRAVQEVSSGDLVVDLGDLDFIDVAGARALVSFDRAMATAGRRLGFRGARRMAGRLLELFGLDPTARH